MSGNTGYYTPSGYGNGEYEEKRSRFISYLDTVESEEEAKAFAKEYNAIFIKIAVRWINF